MSRSSHTKASTQGRSAKASVAKASVALLALALVLPACRKSPTAKQIKGFADKVCACKDAACAESVQTEYLDWWKGNMRARGSEGDRKGVEKAMERYAECPLALVGPEAADAPVTTPVPKVNLQAPIAPAPEAKSPTVEGDGETPAVAPKVAPAPSPESAAVQTKTDSP